mgnify:CR=1 FL=1
MRGRGRAPRWRAVGRLPGDRRRALILRFVDEMSTAEIAGVLGRSEGAVRVLIHRALRSVARDLGDGAPVTRRRSPSRDGDEVDALVTDRYLESLLAAHARGADVAPAAAGLDPAHPPGGATASLATCPRSTRRSGSRSALAARLAEAAAAHAARRGAAGAEGPSSSPAARGGAGPASRDADRRRRRRAARPRPAAADRRRR